MSIKALSLIQPWASLVAVGAKKIETRLWATAHRGLTAIHASKRFPTSCRDFCVIPPFDKYVSEDLPTGAVIAVARLRGVNTTETCLKLLEEKDTEFAREQIVFGDFSPRRFAWVFEGAVCLPTPIPCTGKLGLWDVPDDVFQQITFQLQSRYMK